jgi:hypothetical protein
VQVQVGPQLVADKAQILFVFLTYQPSESVHFEVDCGNAIGAQGMSPRLAANMVPFHFG